MQEWMLLPKIHLYDLKQGLTPLLILPFHAKEKNKKRKIARVFVAQFAHFGLKKVRAVGMSKKLEGHNSNRLYIPILFYFLYYQQSRRMV